MSHHDGGSSAKGLGKSARNRIHKINGAQVQRLLRKLDVISPFLAPQLSSLQMQELTSSKDYTPGEVAVGNSGGFTDDGNGGKADAGMGRHVLQESSILGHLRRIGAFDDDDQACQQLSATITAIEFGAGTGRLSERLQRCTGHRMRHILIDRQEFAPNQCRDSAMRNRAGDNGSVERITGDIADFRLGEHCSTINDGGVNSTKDEVPMCFCVSKHLCGPACDLAIAVLGGKDVPSGRRPPFAFATCCHYLCTWESFSGKDYWIRLGFDEDDFEVAVATSQWYSLNGVKKRIHQNEENMSNSTSNQTSQKDLIAIIDDAGEALRGLSEDMLRPSMSSEEFERAFPREEKAKLGGAVKRLLDLLRIAKLQELGYADAELVLYTTKSIENRLLVGRVV
mmetsp:Transcript_5188/g.14695  ORF Transcript_5188/g.14695 Transcript_5188/m.14695 type:complete len:396 (+) Transcript_5188:71-1258(+)